GGAVPGGGAAQRSMADRGDAGAAHRIARGVPVLQLSAGFDLHGRRRFAGRGVSPGLSHDSHDVLRPRSRHRLVRRVHAAGGSGDSAVRPGFRDVDPPSTGQEPVRGRSAAFLAPIRSPRIDPEDGGSGDLRVHAGDGAGRRSAGATGRLAGGPGGRADVDAPRRDRHLRARGDEGARGNGGPRSGRAEVARGGSAVSRPRWWDWLAFALIVVPTLTRALTTVLPNLYFAQDPTLSPPTFDGLG